MSLTLLNTRPKHQAWSLTEMLSQQGFQVLECPTLQIETQSVELGDLSQDVWVFVSRNAVEHFAKHLSDKNLANHQSWWSGKSLVAVGEATANAMDELGWKNRQAIPNTYDSEGMIALSVFDQPQGLKVAIVRGNGGREWLAGRLTEAGAQVTFYEIYRRVSAPFCHQAWSLLQKAERPVILLTSVSSMQALVQNLTPEHQAWCLQQPLIVFSERIAQAARELGFSADIQVTALSSDQAVLDLLNQWKIDR